MVYSLQSPLQAKALVSARRLLRPRGVDSIISKNMNDAVLSSGPLVFILRRADSTKLHYTPFPFLLTCHRPSVLQQRLSVTDANAALQAQLDEARASDTATRGLLEEARAQASALESALVVPQVTSLGLARASMTSAVAAVNATWTGREAAVQEKHRREKEAWEEAATRYGD